MKCLKCNAERNLQDLQCPECGVFYAKYEAYLEKKAIEDKADIEKKLKRLEELERKEQEQERANNEETTKESDIDANSKSFLQKTAFVISWFLGGIIAIKGISLIFFSILMGLLYIIASLFIIPPCWQFLNTKFKLEGTIPARIGMVIMIIIFGQGIGIYVENKIFEEESEKSRIASAEAEKKAYDAMTPEQRAQIEAEKERKALKAKQEAEYAASQAKIAQYMTETQAKEKSSQDNLQACENKGDSLAGFSEDATYNKVSNDAVEQYKMARRSGSAIDICVQAGFVSAAFLQAKDDVCYAKWKKIESIDCENAGVPR